MNSFSGGGPRQRSRPNLYQLLPTLYRRRDEEIYAADKHRLAANELMAALDVPGAEAIAAKQDVGETHVAPLKALFAIAQRLFDELERDIAALSDDWFVETCAVEMLPLIAEPLGIRALEELRKGHADLRAVVANIVNYRRRKGTAAALEEFAAVASGWTVRVTDGLESLATNARVHADAVRHGGFVDVRRHPPGAGASAQVKSANFRDAGGGVRTATIDVWRLKGAPVTAAEPGRPNPGVRTRRTFSPLGDDKTLMRPIALGGDGDDRRGTSVRPLTRRDARADLAKSGRIVGLSVRQLHLVGDSNPPLQVADLSNWRKPKHAADPRTVYVDPELGRLLTPDEFAVYDVDYTILTHQGIGAVPCSYPWPGSFGRTLLVATPGADRGRSRSRRLEAQLISRVLGDTESFERARSELERVEFEAFFDEWEYVRDTYARRLPRRVPTVGEFVRRWPAFPYAPTGLSVEWLVEVLDAENRRPDPGDGQAQPFERFSGFGAALRAAESASGSVRIVLATSQTHASTGGWTFSPRPELEALSIESAPGELPSIHGPLIFAPHAKPIPIRLLGLNIRGPVVCGANAELTVERSTLRPVKDDRDGGALQGMRDGAPARPIAVRCSILGGAQLTDGELSVDDSVVSGPIAPLDPQRFGPRLTANRSTFLAPVDAYRIEATDALFDAPVTAEDRQHGYLRYCVVRSSERLPQKYKWSLAKEQLLRSTTYGREGFARVRDDARPQVLTGSSQDGEVGAYGPYGNGERKENLRIVMEEFLPERLSSRVRYLT